MYAVLCKVKRSLVFVAIASDVIKKQKTRIILNPRFLIFSVLSYL